MYAPRNQAWMRLDEPSRLLLESAARLELAQRSFTGSIVYFATLCALPLTSSIASHHRIPFLAALLITLVSGIARSVAAWLVIRDEGRTVPPVVILRMGTLLTTAAWGACCAYVLAVYPSQWPSTYLLIAGAALAGGAASSLAPDPMLGILSLAFVVVPTVTLALADGSSASITLGVSALVYLAYLVAQLRYNSRSYWNVATWAALDAMLSKQKVTHQEMKFRGIFDDAPNGIYLARPDGTIETANAALIHMLGFSAAGELVGRNLKEFRLEQERDPMREALNSSVALRGWESIWRRSDGSTLVIRESLRALGRGGEADEVQIQGAVEDVTDLQIAHRARRQLAEILEETSDFVETISPSGECLWANRSARNLLDVGGSFPAQPNESLFHRGGDKYLLAERLRVADSLGIWQGEAWVIGGDDKPVPVSQVIVVHRSPAQETLSYSVISRDMSAIREARRALKETEEQLVQSQRLESLGRLAGGVAHDFNNLLTVIIGHEYLLRDKVTGEDAHSALQAIEGAAARASDLTRQLLAFGRKQMLSRTVVDVNRSIRTTGQMLSRVLGSNIRFATHICDEALEVDADASQLEQMLVNLVLNARDAMPNGGGVTIGAVEVPAPEAALVQGLNPEKKYVRILITDTGIGMDETTIAQIFEPFFTTKGLGRGTGLGLSTVYGFVNQSGGHIAVHSTPGVGTTFEIYLLKSTATQPTSPKSRASATRQGGERVLVLDDEPALRSLLRQTLAGHGYRVSEAATGEEALAVAEAAPESFDLLVTDVVMPGLTGPQTAKKLRDRFPEVAVLFVSGYPGETEAERVSFSDTAGYLSKPFSSDSLLRAVREQLDRVERPASEI